ncbi:uncharacterized protein MELLADRAFT_72570 [Melampsora larici-populina 98AG31]|uniref:Ras modification protein ERF4 n=1 Tax=Melampsora larici-populina (strain 98AG31 / pathotype 3-4-7) TaxID=747676 RepID=F4RW26_MELLP|nr:uncharacterized protein MELLADRAFT_72570 [Melampsora larici-populina 98AG31]EGG03483.1 hypothetical protein MELLADRAFT_72570 [Melampsora larici-populina 98AG31]
MGLPQLKLTNPPSTSTTNTSTTTNPISMKQIDPSHEPSTSTLSIKLNNPSSFHQSNLSSSSSSSDSNHQVPSHNPTTSLNPSSNPMNPTDSHQTQTPHQPQPQDIIEENPAQEAEEEEDQEPIEIFGTSPIGIIGKTKPRAIVRIERDYSAKGATSGRVQFWDGWVTELEGRITPLQLQNTLNDLNGILASAYDPYKSILDNTFSVLSLYLLPLIITPHYKKEMIRFTRTLELVNQSLLNPVGLNLLHPRKVAFLFLEIEYY